MLIAAVLFPEHFSKNKNRADVISHIQTFRDYFHYHIKASKVKPSLRLSLPFSTDRLRHSYTPECAGEQQTFFRFFVVLAQKMRRRSVRLPADVRSRCRDSRSREEVAQYPFTFNINQYLKPALFFLHYPAFSPMMLVDDANILPHGKPM